MKFTRITVNPNQMDGIPCIRGLRIPVATVVEMVADDMSEGEILKALALLTTYGGAFNAIEPCVTKIHSALQAEFEHNPSWETLFGSLSFCECEHCRSMYSPAAYLVDILHFLREHHLYNRESNTTSSALDTLWKRRPDIGEIELTCENTNTPVPYMDLVNEVLENAISPFSWSLQTHGTADELSANPEHSNPAAYDKLAEQVYPWNLPFNLWVEEVRTYLGYLGVPRYQLMETFQKQGAPSKPTDTNLRSKKYKL